MIKYNNKINIIFRFIVIIFRKVEPYMIKIKLSDLLGKHKMSQKALSDLTHIRPATISKMYYEETKRLDIKQLNNICRVFNCEISDLLEYIPDNDKIE